MADAPTVNALKAIETQMKETNRLLKNISTALTALNTNYVAVNQRPKDEVTIDASRL